MKISTERKWYNYSYFTATLPHKKQTYKKKKKTLKKQNNKNDITSSLNQFISDPSKRMLACEISSRDETCPGMKSSLSMVKCLLLFARFCRD